ncbi:disintegrin and metalloproteinase domain-containing protein 19-like [Narcine bancroftii]|uniref:disintegrin and metalloproteinase domain-containing protein 19-like n=1 Tax=Narcine bancroftii TaxID=1343680 RepID=UPI0038310D17
MTGSGSVLLMAVAGWLFPSGVGGDPEPHWEPRAGHRAGLRQLAGNILKEKLFQYRVISPFIVSEGQMRNMDHIQQINYTDEIEVWVEIEEHHLTLDLRRNPFLIPQRFQVSYYDANGRLVTEQNSTLNRCYYEGTVRGFFGSQVAASVCSGLGALIILTNASYVIEHLEGDGHGYHLIFRPEHLKLKEIQCSSGHLISEYFQHPVQVKRSLGSEMKHLELVLVADRAEYQNAFNSKRKVINRLANAVNYVDLFYRPLYLRIALIGIEVWTTDQIEVDDSALTTMKRFLKWRKTNLLPRQHNDNAQLIMGRHFNNISGQLAEFGSMCSQDYSGGIVLDTTAEILAIASNLAHGIGHNLGMDHDSPAPKCVCTDKKADCIMAEVRGPRPAQVFSSCSKRSLQQSLARGIGMCLYNLPDPSLLVRGQKCGNSYVDSGEECDCGKPENCMDPCCIASLCKFRPGAKCASSDICCRNCKFVKPNRICRKPIGECDFAEYCTGSSSKCPSNMFKKNFYPCANGTSYCYNGACQTLHTQCQNIWGPTSVPSPNLCYWYMNIIGNQFGNCGRKEDGSFVSCSIKDVRCGKLQCNGKGISPAIGGRTENVVSQFSNKGKNIECFGTYFTGDAEGIDMVADGTPCGLGKACFNSICRSVAGFGVAKCNKYCSGHGVCNNNDTCYCDPGWVPPNCTSGGQSGHVDNVPWSSQQPAEKINPKVVKSTSGTSENNFLHPKGRPAGPGNVVESSRMKNPKTTTANPGRAGPFETHLIIQGGMLPSHRTPASGPFQVKFGKGTSFSSLNKLVPTAPQFKQGVNTSKAATPETMVSCAHTGTPVWLMVFLLLILLLLLVTFLLLLYYLRKENDSNDNVSERSNLSENSPTVRFFTSMS